MLDCVVIGSGPSGTACASALIARGRRVRMIDAGQTLEPERAAMVRGARATAEVLRPGAAPWAPAQDAADGEIPRKRLFGSDYPYDGAAEGLGVVNEGVGLEPSFAYGGHSTVWGCAVMPYAQRDIADWPIRASDLAPHYEACAGLLGLSGEEDDLAEEFPLFTRPAGQLPASAQAQMLLRSLTRNRDKLRAAGLRFGRARLAVRSPSAGEGCVSCGLCLTGCPYEATFRTTPLIERMVRDGSLDYAPGLVVDTVADGEGGAVVRGRSLNSGEPFSLEARRVFLAGGPIGSTAVLMRSGGLHGETVALKDSQYFLAPLLTPGGPPRVADERLHALSQLFMSVVDPALGHEATQFLQIYSYNELLDAELRRKLGPAAFAAGPLLSRMIIVQGYLHSDISGGIDATLEGAAGRDRLRLTPRVNERTKGMVGRLMKKLVGLAPQLGALPATPLLRVGEPGRGFHAGGSFPMAAAPGRHGTDTLGRPFGWRRVHAVDASVLPSIAATTITFTVMANAHRIASTAADMDRAA